MQPPVGELRKAALPLVCYNTPDTNETTMNQTLEKAVSLARTLTDADQEDLGNELIRLAEEKRIDARLAESEASGNPISHDEFWADVDARIAEHKKSNHAGE